MLVRLSTALDAGEFGRGEAFNTGAFIMAVDDALDAFDEISGSPSAEQDPT